MKEIKKYSLEQLWAVHVCADRDFLQGRWCGDAANGGPCFKKTKHVFFIKKKIKTGDTLVTSVGGLLKVHILKDDSLKSCWVLVLQTTC